MSTQIAVRLPDDLVASVDALVAAGEARSRASVIERALRRELRKLEYAREAAMRAADPERFRDPELEAMAEWGARDPLGLDD